MAGAASPRAFSPRLEPSAPSLQRHAATNRFETRPRDRLRSDCHRAGVRVRLLGLAGLQGAAVRRARGHPRQQQPGDDHDRPGTGRPHLCRAAHGGLPRGDHRTRAAGRHSADGRRPDRPQSRRRSVERRRSLEVQRQADRRLDRGDQDRRGPSAVQGRDARHRSRSPAERPGAHAAGGGRSGAHARVPAGDPAVVHTGRRRRRHRLQHRGVPRARGPRARA